MRCENSHLLIMASCANDLDFALRSQFTSLLFNSPLTLAVRYRPLPPRIRGMIVIRLPRLAGASRLQRPWRIPGESLASKAAMDR